MKPRQSRIHLQAPITWTASFESTILNISIGGLYFRASNRPPEGATIDLEFSLPENSETIKARAAVRWVSTHSESSATPTVYGVGVEFTGLQPDDQAKLEQFIEANKDRQRKNQRHRIKLLVEYHFAGQNFRCIANDISRTGMFIVTSEPLQLEDMLQARFQLPNSGARMNIRSIVRWRHADIPSNLTSVVAPGMGIEFLNVASEDRQVIEEYIKELESSGK